MPYLIDLIEDYSPASGASSVPLSSVITVTFSCLMDEDDLGERFFIEGPDTDQFIGPGLAEFNIYPDNVSQGDDLLESPGYSGIVQGTITCETITGNKTKLTFTPTQPMYPLTEYTAHLPQADNAGGTTYTGAVKFSWTTGSGSIEALPSTSSTSVLMSVVPSSTAAEIDLEVEKVTPLNNAAEIEVDLEQIEIEFNKEIHSDSVNSDNISVKAYKATDHPSASVEIPTDNKIAAQLSVSGKKIVIGI